MEFVIPLVLAAAVLFLFLTILGTMREVTLLRGEVAAFRQLILKPPVPSFATGPLPAVATEALSALPSRDDRTHALLFLSQGCGGCDDLVRKMGAAIRSGAVSSDDFTFVISAASRDSGLVTAASAVTSRVLLDASDEIFKACEVRSTPTLFIVAGSSPQVTDYVFGGDVEWIRQRVRRTTTLLSPI